jgi:hypothetical protein
MLLRLAGYVFVRTFSRYILVLPFRVTMWCNVRPLVGMQDTRDVRDPALATR